MFKFWWIILIYDLVFYIGMLHGYKCASMLITEARFVCMHDNQHVQEWVHDTQTWYFYVDRHLVISWITSVIFVFLNPICSQHFTLVIASMHSLLFPLLSSSLYALPLGCSTHAFIGRVAATVVQNMNWVLEANSLF